MKKIASFCVDHTKIKPGIYISRQDDDIITYDLRMKHPNKGDYLAIDALHTLEHLLATYVRNSNLADNVIYAGPMGCRTGFYLLLRNTPNEDAIQLVQDAFKFISEFEGEIPGASEIECGNYLEQNLMLAKQEAGTYFDAIKNYSILQINY